MKSIIQEKKECYICKSQQWLECHHIFAGTANKKQSEKYGLKVYLCNSCHRQAQLVYDSGLELKQVAQQIAMKHYGWTVGEFRKIFGKNYL